MLGASDENLEFIANPTLDDDRNVEVENFEYVNEFVRFAASICPFEENYCGFYSGTASIYFSKRTFAAFIQENTLVVVLLLEHLFVE